MTDRIRLLSHRWYWEPRDLMCGLSFDHDDEDELVKTVRLAPFPGLSWVLQLHLPTTHEREWQSFTCALCGHKSSGVAEGATHFFDCPEMLHGEELK